MADVLPSEELLDEASDFGTLRPGTRLGRYELLVPIARGGMARVWAARLHGHRGFSKLVAIKTILPHLASEPEFERMFLDEARIAAGVHHPNVCEIYELGEDKRTLYLAMEWVSGDSFSRVLRASGKTEGLDPRVVARIIADASAGLHAAHELTDDDGKPLGVVHRDLSPHNILLTADGVAKVADFGVAKAFNQLHEATSAGQLKGKIAYMAPEQVSAGTVDRRSDIFSMGCVLYEASTGQRPFRGEGEAQIMHAVLKGEFPAPTTLVRAFPQELERIILRAMSPQPILRFPTAERLRFALEEFLARGPLVTQSNVAQVVRARIGDPIEKRKERIRQASSAGDREGGHTPSDQRQDHRSGVKPAVVRPLSNEPASILPPPLATTAYMPGAPPIPMPAMNPQVGFAPAQAPSSYSQHSQHSHHSQSGYSPHHSQSGYSAHHSQPGYSPHLSQPGYSPHLSQPGYSPHLSQPGYAPHLSQSGFPPAPPQGYPAHVAPPPPAFNPHYSSPHYSYPGNGLAPHLAPAMGPTVQTPGHALSTPNTIPPPGSLPPNPTVPPVSGPMLSGEWSNPGVRIPTIPPSGGMALYDQAGAEPPPPEAPPAGIGSYVVAAGIGLLVAALIGGGGFFLWRTRSATMAQAAPAVATTTIPQITSVAPEPKASAHPPATAEIAFRSSPSEATFTVDGRDLGTIRSIPRPAAGQTVTVVAHANGFEDATILVDYFTPSPTEVTLKASPPIAAAVDTAAPTNAAPAAAAEEKPPESKAPSEKKTEKHDKPRERKDPTPLPANPY